MKTIFAIMFLGLLSISCNKALEEGSGDIPTDLTVISQGSFNGAAHPTTGTVKLSKDTAGKKYLVFENFSTDAGPDIRIWIAEDKSANNYTELSKTVFTGSFKIDVPAELDTTKKSYVLIWCKAFAVLFGSAQLK
ncbi:MAG: DM13 domain-containing protein [Saprospiraceae bacterium]